jgi:pimeloyl-ACP methyl ester carboxylesterase
MALAHPKEIAGVVLISGYYYPTPRADVPFFAAPAIPVLGDILCYTVSPSIARMSTPALFQKMFSPRPVPKLFEADFPKAPMVRPWQIRASAEDTALMEPAAAELQPGYSTMRMPVIILAGAEDAIVDVQDQAVRLNRDIPRSELRVKAGVGHMLHHAVPRMVADAIETAAAGGDRLLRSGP